MISKRKWRVSPVSVLVLVSGVLEVNAFFAFSNSRLGVLNEIKHSNTRRKHTPSWQKSNLAKSVEQNAPGIYGTHGDTEGFFSNEGAGSGAGNSLESMQFSNEARKEKKDKRGKLRSLLGAEVSNSHSSSQSVEDVKLFSRGKGKLRETTTPKVDVEEGKKKMVFMKSIGKYVFVDVDPPTTTPPKKENKASEISGGDRSSSQRRPGERLGESSREKKAYKSQKGSETLGGKKYKDRWLLTSDSSEDNKGKNEIEVITTTEAPAAMTGRKFKGTWLWTPTSSEDKKLKNEKVELDETSTVKAKKRKSTQRKGTKRVKTTTTIWPKKKEKVVIKSIAKKILKKKSWKEESELDDSLGSEGDLLESEEESEDVEKIKDIFEVDITTTPYLKRRKTTRTPRKVSTTVRPVTVPITMAREKVPTTVFSQTIPTTVAATEIPTTLTPEVITTTVATETIPTTVATTATRATVATEAIPTTVATAAIPTTVATEAIPTTVATEAIPTTVATEVIPTTAATEAIPTTVATESISTTMVPGAITTTVAPEATTMTVAPETITTTEAVPMTVAQDNIVAHERVAPTEEHVEEQPKIATKENGGGRKLLRVSKNRKDPSPVKEFKDPSQAAINDVGHLNTQRFSESTTEVSKPFGENLVKGLEETSTVKETKLEMASWKSETEQPTESFLIAQEPHRNNLELANPKETETITEQSVSETTIEMDQQTIGSPGHFERRDENGDPSHFGSRKHLEPPVNTVEPSDDMADSIAIEEVGHFHRPKDIRQSDETKLRDRFHQLEEEGPRHGAGNRAGTVGKFKPHQDHQTIHRFDSDEDKHQEAKWSHHGNTKSAPGAGHNLAWNPLQNGHTKPEHQSQQISGQEQDDDHLKYSILEDEPAINSNENAPYYYRVELEKVQNFASEESDYADRLSQNVSAITEKAPQSYNVEREKAPHLGPNERVDTIAGNYRQTASPTISETEASLDNVELEKVEDSATGENGVNDAPVNPQNISTTTEKESFLYYAELEKVGHSEVGVSGDTEAVTYQQNTLASTERESQFNFVESENFDNSIEESGSTESPLHAFTTTTAPVIVEINTEISAEGKTISEDVRTNAYPIDIATTGKSSEIYGEIGRPRVIKHQNLTMTSTIAPVTLERTGEESDEYEYVYIYEDTGELASIKPTLRTNITTTTNLVLIQNSETATATPNSIISNLSTGIKSKDHLSDVQSNSVQSGTNEGNRVPVRPIDSQAPDQNPSDIGTASREMYKPKESLRHIETQTPDQEPSNIGTTSREMSEPNEPLRPIEHQAADQNPSNIGTASRDMSKPMEALIPIDSKAPDQNPSNIGTASRDMSKQVEPLRPLEPQAPDQGSSNIGTASRDMPKPMEPLRPIDLQTPERGPADIVPTSREMSKPMEPVRPIDLQTPERGPSDMVPTSREMPKPMEPLRPIDLQTPQQGPSNIVPTSRGMSKPMEPLRPIDLQTPERGPSDIVPTSREMFKRMEPLRPLEHQRPDHDPSNIGTAARELSRPVEPVRSIDPQAPDQGTYNVGTASRDMSKPTEPLRPLDHQAPDQYPYNIETASRNFSRPMEPHARGNTITHNESVTMTRPGPLPGSKQEMGTLPEMKGLSKPETIESASDQDNELKQGSLSSLTLNKMKSPSGVNGTDKLQEYYIVPPKPIQKPARDPSSGFINLDTLAIKRFRSSRLLTDPKDKMSPHPPEKSAHETETTESSGSEPNHAVSDTGFNNVSQPEQLSEQTEVNSTSGVEKGKPENLPDNQSTQSETVSMNLGLMDTLKGFGRPSKDIERSSSLRSFSSDERSEKSTHAPTKKRSLDVFGGFFGDSFGNGESGHSKDSWIVMSSDGSSNSGVVLPSKPSGDNSGNELPSGNNEDVKFPSQLDHNEKPNNMPEEVDAQSVKMTGEESKSPSLPNPGMDEDSPRKAPQGESEPVKPDLTEQQNLLRGLETNQPTNEQSNSRMNETVEGTGLQSISEPIMPSGGSVGESGSERATMEMFSSMLTERIGETDAVKGKGKAAWVVIHSNGTTSKGRLSPEGGSDNGTDTEHDDEKLGMPEQPDHNEQPENMPENGGNGNTVASDSSEALPEIPKISDQNSVSNNSNQEDTQNDNEKKVNTADPSDQSTTMEGFSSLLTERIGDTNAGKGKGNLEKEQGLEGSSEKIEMPEQPDHNQEPNDMPEKADISSVENQEVSAPTLPKNPTSGMNSGASSSNGKLRGFQTTKRREETELTEEKAFLTALDKQSSQTENKDSGGKMMAAMTETGVRDVAEPDLPSSHKERSVAEVSRNDTQMAQLETSRNQMPSFDFFSKFNINSKIPMKKSSSSSSSSVITKKPALTGKSSQTELENKTAEKSTAPSGNNDAPKEQTSDVMDFNRMSSLDTLNSDGQKVHTSVENFGDEMAPSVDHEQEQSTENPKANQSLIYDNQTNENGSSTESLVSKDNAGEAAA